VSVFEVSTSWLSLKPRVYGDDDALCCETSIFAQLATLLAYHRRVVVDREKRVVQVDERSWWWRQSSLEIPFSRVCHIEYEFDSLPTAFAGVVAADSVERFTVSLVLRNPEEMVRLATFDGEGSTITAGLGVLAGDTLFELCGDQGNASRMFVAALKRLLGVPIGLPVPRVADERGVRYRCAACGQPSPPRRRKCQYCGGAVAEEPAASTERGTP